MSSVSGTAINLGLHSVNEKGSLHYPKVLCTIYRVSLGTVQVTCRVSQDTVQYCILYVHMRVSQNISLIQSEAKIAIKINSKQMYAKIVQIKQKS